MSFQNTASTVHVPRYEREQVLNQYLLFHYGSDADQMPFDLHLKKALNFSVRCVSECLDFYALSNNAKALELGCSVGRTSFELSRHCESVVAIDSSKAFIAAAKQIQKNGQLEYHLTVEGAQRVTRYALLPESVNANRVQFRGGDALNLVDEHTAFDVVLAANVLCRLRDPMALLAELPHLTATNGQLILISPYSWSKEFTLPNHWMGGAEDNQGKSTFEYIKDALGDYFEHKATFDMPFMMREHFRKYELGMAQATLWTRNNVII
jgi:putative 4-mercaptohistidine N1-methyltranferase